MGPRGASNAAELTFILSISAPQDKNTWKSKLEWLYLPGSYNLSPGRGVNALKRLASLLIRPAPGTAGSGSTASLDVG